jgi:GNAT superfamily N-acetyltransferase
VRLAWAADAGRIGAVQAAALRRQYAALLPADVVAGADAESSAAAWQAALRRAPSGRHRVLVALDQHGNVAGFAALAPCGDPDADPVADAELVVLHVDPEATRRGHGSRLLAAAVDTARADGFSELRTWVLVGDDPLRAFLGSAGWAPDGARRRLAGEGPSEVAQIRLHTAVAAASTEPAAEPEEPRP